MRNTRRRVFDIATSQPWVITEEALRTVCAIAEGSGRDLETLAARTGRPLGNAHNVRMHNGVAVIPVVGPIFRYANLFTDVSGATSTEILARDITTALEDPSVEAIVLDINSPGGAVAGINELSDMIFEGRQVKRIVTYGGAHMESGGYWLGSSADEIVIDRTAIVGCIGAKMTFVDSSARDARMGVRTIEIVSSQSPDKVLDPNVDAGRAKLQKIVDDLGGVFVAAVARNRGIDEETVLAEYGQGGSMVGERAVAAGLADRIGSLESVIAELAGARQLSTRGYFMTTPAKAKKGPISVSTTAELQAALVAGHTPEEITLQTVDTEAIKAAARTSALAEAESKHKSELETATKTAREDAAAAERKRIVALQAIAVAGFETQISAAIESGATAEVTAIEIAKLQKDRGTTLHGQRAAAPQALSHGGAQPQQAGEVAVAAANRKTIVDRINKKRGFGK